MTIHMQDMVAWAVGVPMYQVGIVVLAQSTEHGIMIHVHDFMAFPVLFVFAACAQLGDESLARGQRLGKELLLPGRIGHLLAPSLISVVIGT